MRYLLVHHPLIVCAVLFGMVMLAIRYGLAPWIVGNYGFAGVALFIAAMLGLAFFLDRPRPH